MSFMERSKELINKSAGATPPRPTGAVPPRPTGMPPRPGAVPPRPGAVPPRPTGIAPPKPVLTQNVTEEKPVEEVKKPKATDGLLKDNPFAKIKKEKEAEEKIIKAAENIEATPVAEAVEAPVQEPTPVEEVSKIDESVDEITEEVLNDIESKEEAAVEVKEEAKEEAKEEVKSEVKEGPKKKSRPVRKSKKKVLEETESKTEEVAQITSSDSAAVAPTAPVIDTNIRSSISFDEAMNSIKSSFVDENWEQVRESASNKLKDIVITNDMNTSNLKSVLSELSELKTEIWDVFADTKTKYESLVSKEPAGLIERIRVVNSNGSNTEQRKANGIMAVINYKDASGNSINLFELLDEIRDRYNFLKGLMDIIDYKSKLLVTMLGGLKLEK